MPHKNFSSAIKKILPAKSYKLLRPFLSNMRKGSILFEIGECKGKGKKKNQNFSKKGLHFESVCAIIRER